MDVKDIKMSEAEAPWVHKYRPSTLDGIISQPDVIKTIQRFIDEGDLPHLLFHGPAGTGKTSTIMAVARQLYTPKQMSSMVLVLNASDERGINTIRETILNFASTRTIFKGGYKLIILDESDGLTKDAQAALRRIMEKFVENVRFCLICNWVSKLIPAIKSRCTEFRFKPLKPEMILPRLEYIIEAEKCTRNSYSLHIKIQLLQNTSGCAMDFYMQINIDEKAKQALLTLCNGDMRKVINLLQCSTMTTDTVEDGSGDGKAYTITEDNIYTLVGRPYPRDIENCVKWLLNDTFSSCYSNINKLRLAKGLALNDIITEIHLYIHRIELPVNVMCVLLIKMADIEQCCSKGASEKIQLAALVAAFYKVRVMISKVEKVD